MNVRVYFLKFLRSPYVSISMSGIEYRANERGERVIVTS